MIKWITDVLGTCAYSKISSGTDYKIIDVRDLVDKSGNSEAHIKKKIDLALTSLRDNNRTVICCDYGISRSNAIAVGVLSKLNNILFDDALRIVLDKTKEEIKLEVLLPVKKALGEDCFVKNVSERKKILIIGGGGLIGQSAIPVLKHHADICCPTRQELDISFSPVRINQFCEKNDITHILNLAYPRISNTYSAFGESIGMLRNILEVIKNQKHIHLTCISDWVVFAGYNSTYLTVNEDTPLCPKGLYAETQYFRENLIKYYLNKYDNLKISTIRLSNVYGFMDKPKFIYNYISKALNNEDIYTHVYINSVPKLHMIHINDVIEALKLWFSKEPKVNCYNLSGDDFLSTRVIAEKVIALTEAKGKIRTNKIEAYTGNIFLDSQRFRKDFQWSPKKSFSVILPELIQNAKKEILWQV